MLYDPPRNLHRATLVAAVLACAAAGASAQEFNIDTSQDFGTPANAYAAATGQTGFWNPIPAVPVNTLYSLSDTSGAATVAQVMYTLVGNSVGNFSFNNALTSGDDQALLDDLQDVGSGTSLSTWTFSGLAAGSYELYTYSWAPDDRVGFTTRIKVLGSPDPETIMTGGLWPGSHVLGVTYAKHRITIAAGANLVMEARPNTGFGSVNGFQLVDVGGGGPTVYCTARVTSCGSIPTVGGPSGVASISAGAGSFNVTCGLVPDQGGTGSGPGLVLHTASGQHPTKPLLPFGFQCVNTPFFRGPAAVAGTGGPGTCDATFVWDFGGYLAANAGSFGIVAGNTCDLQPWYRDPTNAVNPPGGTANFANAMAFMLAP